MYLSKHSQDSSLSEYLQLAVELSGLAWFMHKSASDLGHPWLILGLSMPIYIDYIYIIIVIPIVHILWHALLFQQIWGTSPGGGKSFWVPAIADSISSLAYRAITCCSHSALILGKQQQDDLSFLPFRQSITFHFPSCFSADGPSLKHPYFNSPDAEGQPKFIIAIETAHCAWLRWPRIWLSILRSLTNGHRLLWAY